MDLPCKHLMHFCQRNDVDSFLPHLCAKRWSKNYYNASHPGLQLKENVLSTAPIYIQAVRTPLEKDKYKKSANVTKEINLFMSTMPPDKFAYFKDAINDNNAENENVAEVIENASSTSDMQNRFDGTLSQPALNTPLLSGNGTTYMGGWMYFPNITQINSAASQIIVNGEQINLNRPPINPNAHEINSPMIASTSGYKASVPSQASNVSEVDIVTARKKELQSIILPSKNASIGRPKGRVTTIIGTKRKKAMPKTTTTAAKQSKVFILNYFY